MLMKFSFLAFLLFAVLPNQAQADKFSFSYNLSFPFFGPGLSPEDAKLAFKYDNIDQFELLYLYGEQYGPLIGVVTGTNVRGYITPKDQGEPREKFSSEYAFNGLKLGGWLADPSGITGILLFTYGRGSFDFTSEDVGSIEKTEKYNFAELEGRVTFPIYTAYDVSFDLYGGLRMNQMFAKDFEYNGTTYSKEDIADWHHINVSAGVGISY